VTGFSTSRNILRVLGDKGPLGDQSANSEVKLLAPGEEGFGDPIQMSGATKPLEP
jgi:hypothetical protein